MPKESSARKDSHVNILYSAEDEREIADIPNLERCFAFGDTPDEPLKEVELARRVWLAAAWAEKEPIPERRYLPAMYETASRRQLPQVADKRQSDRDGTAEPPPEWIHDLHAITPGGDARRIEGRSCGAGGEKPRVMWTELSWLFV